MMSKKDYELIAKTIREHYSVRIQRNAPQPIWEEQQQEISLALGMALEKDNSRFDLGRFLAACEGKIE
jgi:hypothetical protein